MFSNHIKVFAIKKIGQNKFFERMKMTNKINKLEKEKHWTMLSIISELVYA